MSRDISPFPVRLPADLREKLDVEREKMGRSLNSEIVARLEASFTNTMDSNQRLAYGYGFASGAIQGLLRKIVDDLQSQIPETTEPTLEVIGDSVEYFLEDLERSHQNALSKVASPNSHSPTSKP